MSACVVNWSAVAAWVQAIGSVLAIIFAIRVGKESDRRARELVDSERKRQSRIVAAVFALQFQRLAHEISVKMDVLSEFDEALSRGETPLEIQEFFAFRYSAPLLEHRSEALLLDQDSGIAVAGVLDLISAFSTKVHISLNTWRATTDGEVRSDCYKGLKKNITTLRDLCTNNHEHLVLRYELVTPSDTSPAT
jgi:hypothetical protein